MTPEARKRSAVCFSGWFLAITGWACVGILLLAMSACYSAPTKAQCRQAVEDCPTGSCVVVTDQGPVHVDKGQCV